MCRPMKEGKWERWGEADREEEADRGEVERGGGNKLACSLVVNSKINRLDTCTLAVERPVPEEWDYFFCQRGPSYWHYFLWGIFLYKIISFWKFVSHVLDHLLMSKRKLKGDTDNLFFNFDVFFAMKIPFSKIESPVAYFISWILLCVSSSFLWVSYQRGGERRGG